MTETKTSEKRVAELTAGIMNLIVEEQTKNGDDPEMCLLALHLVSSYVETAIWIHTKEKAHASSTDNGTNVPFVS